MLRVRHEEDIPVRKDEGEVCASSSLPLFLSSSVSLPRSLSCSQIGLASFMRWLVDNLGAENLLFWRAVEEHRASGWTLDSVTLSSLFPPPSLCFFLCLKQGGSSRSTTPLLWPSLPHPLPLYLFISLYLLISLSLFV